MKPVEKSQLELAIMHLAKKCDHASSEDGKGFSKFDADFGHAMAERAKAGYSFSPSAWAGMQRLAKKYRKQLEQGGFDMELVLDCEQPAATKPSEADKAAAGWAKMDGKVLVRIEYDSYLGPNKTGKMLGFHAAYMKGGVSHTQEFWFPSSLVGGSKDELVVPLWLARDRNLHRIIPERLKVL